ncbi:hypothetical protein [Cardinium endosymbiont of Sogatella furcifera]|uniref:hypothetical protein n=1 Tax=Cardinium endosymbiont of Sogatella furcifera TaxID=650378 RepID=UPI0013B458D8|nr:hypothetical protein [Cardinium endosymbiont of Sogatella furcifera]
MRLVPVTIVVGLSQQYMARCCYPLGRFIKKAHKEYEEYQKYTAIKKEYEDAEDEDKEKLLQKYIDQYKDQDMEYHLKHIEDSAYPLNDKYSNHVITISRLQNHTGGKKDDISIVVLRIK